MMKCNVEQVEVATLSHMKGPPQTHLQTHLQQLLLHVCFPGRTAGIDHRQSSDSCDIDHRQSSDSCDIDHRQSSGVM